MTYFDYEALAASNLSYDDKINLLEFYKKDINNIRESVSRMNIKPEMDYDSNIEQIDEVLDKFKNGDYLEPMMDNLMKAYSNLDKTVNIGMIILATGVLGLLGYASTGKEYLCYIPVTAGIATIIDAIFGYTYYHNFNKYTNAIDDYQMRLNR